MSTTNGDDNYTSEGGPFCLNAIIPLKADRRAEFLKVMIDDQKGTLEEEKESIQFVIGEDLTNANTFYLYEEYSSKAAFDLHNEQPHFAPWKAFCETSPFTSDPVPHMYIGNHQKKLKGEKKVPVRFAACVNACYKVKPEKKEEFIKAIQELQEACSKEKDFLQFHWGECTTTANTFYVHKEFGGKDTQGLVAHEESEHYKKFAEFADYYEKDPVIQKFKTIPMNPNNKEIWKEDVWTTEDGKEEKIVEVEEEPNHNIDWTNKYTRNITIRMKPGGTTLAHRHEIDTVVFILMENGIDFINDVMGCGAKKGHMNFGAVGFSPFAAEPCVHKITNLTPDRMYIINHEIYPNVGPPPITQSKPLDESTTKHSLVMEKHNCRVYKLSLKKDESAEVAYNFYYTRVMLRDGKLQTNDATKHEELTMGECHAKEPSGDVPLKITNAGDGDLEYYIIELKGKEEEESEVAEGKRPLEEKENDDDEKDAKKAKTTTDE